MEGNWDEGWVVINDSKGNPHRYNRDDVAAHDAKPQIEVHVSIGMNRGRIINDDGIPRLDLNNLPQCVVVEHPSGDITSRGPAMSCWIGKFNYNRV
jgi:hypothetical protein